MILDQLQSNHYIFPRQRNKSMILYSMDETLKLLGINSKSVSCPFLYSICWASLCQYFMEELHRQFTGHSLILSSLASFPASPSYPCVQLGGKCYPPPCQSCECSCHFTLPNLNSYQWFCSVE